MHCSDFFAERVGHKQSPILLGLDPIYSRLPSHLPGDTLAGIRVFCHSLIESCAPQVCGIKLQLACFECLGSPGIALVEQLISYARGLELLVVVDGKRGDIATTAEAYANAYLDPGSPLAADALTINPWLGADSMQPFVDAANAYNRMLFVLVHTSNPDAKMFQLAAKDKLIGLINDWNNQTTGNNDYGRVGAVVGATNTAMLESWANRLNASWLLTPGLGAQQGDDSELAKLQRGKAKLLIPISRAIIYASNGSDFANAAAQVAADYRMLLR